MEFHEKLQELRRQKGLTQEELAQTLYVSRTAISKWESGRGFPNIESLKAISSCFGVSIDELLSSDELLAIAEDDHKTQEKHTLDLVFGLLDCGAALLFALPFFGQSIDGIMQAVSLLSLTAVSPWLMTAYIAVVIVAVMLGILMLALQNWRNPVWANSKHIASLVWNAATVLLFILSRQPYAGMLCFVFLIIKGILLLKRR